MKFVSETQRQMFKKQVADGELDQKTFDEWNANSQAILPNKAPKKFKDVKPVKAETPKEKSKSWKVQKVKPAAKVKKA